MTHQSGNTLQNILIPLAILIAGFAIAASIYLNRSTVKSEKITVTNTTENTFKPDAFIPVSKNDNIKGDLNTARIVIVDYSDLECPYCKILHETISQVYDDYAATGKVAWVYRHFPLSIHSKAPQEASAAECARELGGNDSFWKFISKVYAVTPSNDQLDSSELPKIASEIGLDQTEFGNCLSSGKYSQKIKESFENSLKLIGKEVTPFTVLIVDGKVIPLVDEEGTGLGAALPYPAFKALIDQFLK